MVEMLLTVVMFTAFMIYMFTAIRCYIKEKRRIWVKGKIVGTEWECTPKIEYSYNNNTYCVVNEDLKTTQFSIEKGRPVVVYIDPHRPDDASFKKITLSTITEMWLSIALTVFAGMHFVYMYDFNVFEAAMSLIYIAAFIAAVLALLKEMRNVSKDIENSISVEGKILYKKVKNVRDGKLVEALVKYEFEGIVFCNKIIEKVVTSPLDSDSITVLVNKDYPDRFHIESSAQNINGSKFLIRLALLAFIITFVLRISLLINMFI